MKFLKELFGIKEKNALKKLGEADKCPFCKKKLEKIPQRKTKCEFCENYMYSRTRPLDKKKVLLTEDQAKEIEIEWQIINGTRERVIKKEQEGKEFESIKQKLRERFGKEPSENDVMWGILNRRLIEYATNRQWGLYTNIKLDMAKILQKENRFKDAIMTLFEVFYLDLNGPSNSRGFNEDGGYIAPWIIDEILQIIKISKLSRKEIEQLFFNRCKILDTNLNLKIKSNIAWLELKTELFSKKDPLAWKEIRFLKKKGIKKIRWLASYGKTTCKICTSYNNRIFDIDKIPKKPHKDCRCTIVSYKEE